MIKEQSEGTERRKDPVKETEFLQGYNIFVFIKTMYIYTFVINVCILEQYLIYLC